MSGRDVGDVSGRDIGDVSGRDVGDVSGRVPTTRLGVALALAAGLAGCAGPSVQQFAGTQPPFDPVRFFTGHVVSWGVLEDRSGSPTSSITTDCMGVPEGSDGVHMIQHLTEGKDHQTRDWHMRRVTPTHFEATATEVLGLAAGDSAGRVFHWTYDLATDPGNPLKNVHMDQWMYLMDDGSMINRATITKLGVTVAQVTEHFTHAQSAAE